MKIVFAHNVYNRFKTLKETINIERSFFPDAQEFIACNSYKNDEFFSQENNLSIKYYMETPQHKIGCVNGLMLSCNMSLETDFDVLIFSHDDVRINPKSIDVVMNHITSVFENKCDLVYRNPVWYGNEYAMMEVIFMNRRAVEALFTKISLLKSESEIDKYKNGSICPELWFYKKIATTNLKSNIIKYVHSESMLYNVEMPPQVGYIHLNAGLRGWSD
jgi:hypothetical protein